MQEDLLARRVVGGRVDPTLDRAPRRRALRVLQRRTGQRPDRRVESVHAADIKAPQQDGPVFDQPVPKGGPVTPNPVDDPKARLIVLHDERQCFPLRDRVGRNDGH